MIANLEEGLARSRVSILSFLWRPVWVGAAIVLVFFGAFGGWATLAPLNSGAIAGGVVSPTSSRQVIQHLEGGIIRTIHVRDNQRVSKGDALITLEDTRAAAGFASTHEQYLRLLVTRARLDAHAQKAESMVMPSEIAETDEPSLAAFVFNQIQLFDTERRTQQQMVEIYQRRIEQFRSEIEAVTAEIGGHEAQKELIDSDLKDQEGLLERQLVPRAQVTALRRESARLAAAIGAGRAQIARSRQAIEETNLSILRASESFLIEIADSASEINNEIAVLEQDLASGRDILRRTVITSPVDGVVLDLAYKTPGGVVRPGEPILTVVPVDDDMVIVAQLQPRDIELVHEGLEARVSLLPFSSRNLLPLTGVVTDVAADSTYNEAARQHFYEIKVRVPAEEIARQDGVYLGPGMPAEVTVVTGARTMLQYLMAPLARAVSNGFIYD